MKKKLSAFLVKCIIGVFVACSFFEVVYAASVIGFIPGNLWYSKEPFFAEEEIRIYSAVFNGGEATVSGTVEFFDNGVTISEAVFPLLAKGSTAVVSVGWKAAAGSHRISAKIVALSGAEMSVDSLNNETGERTIFVDRDTDKDKIGDEIDTDDDNDGVPDITELEQGTDPTNPDTDGDTILDGVDAFPLNAEIQSSPFSNIGDKNGNAVTPQKIDAKTISSLSGKATQTVKSIIDTIDIFAATQKERVEAKKQELEKELTAIDGNKPIEKEIVKLDIPVTGKSVSVALKDDFASSENKQNATHMIKEGYVFLLAFISYVLGNKVLFYAVIGIVLFLGIRFVWGRIRQKE
ncbi:MAG: hypothetical protein V1652_02270 [bacterium]